MDYLPFGVALVDRSARVLQMNRRAEELLEKQSGLLLLEGRVVAAVATTDVGLRRAIARVCETPGGQALRETRLVVRAAHAQPAILVRVVAAPRGWHPSQLPDGIAILYLFGPALANIRPTILMEIYGLTPAEAEVATRMVAGERPANIGVATGKTLNTVRTHIRRVFTKSGCRTQSAFVLEVLTGPAMLISPELVMSSD